MGKRYYCDYCNKTMSCLPSLIKTHNNGILHQTAKQEHFQKFKDPEVILEEELKKKPCTRYPTGNCYFGSLCRFSHYSPEAIQSLQNYVATKRLAETMLTQPHFQDLYEKLQMKKSTCIEDGSTILVDDNGITHKLPWHHNPVLDANGLPPSVRHISVNDFRNVTFSEWG